MIYASSLNVPVKRTFKDKAQQSIIQKVISILPMDPKETEMDVLFLGPKDARGTNGVKLAQAIKTAHPDICIIYMYQKDADKELIPCQYTFKCKAIDSKSLKEAFDEFVTDRDIRRGKTQMSSADFQAVETDESVPVKEELLNESFDMNGLRDPEAALRAAREEQERLLREAAESQQEVKEETKSAAEAVAGFASADPIAQSLYDLDAEMATAAPQEEEPKEDPLASFNIPESAPDTTPEPLPEAPLTSASFSNELPPIPTVDERVEEFVKGAANPEDWRIFKERLKHDTVVQSLIGDNAEYKGVVQMLEVLDKRIQSTYCDTALSPDEKFKKITEIGMERSTLRATANSIHIERAIAIITAITISAKQAVEFRVEELERAMHKIIVDKSVIEDMSSIHKAIEARAKATTNLLNLSRDIVDLFKSINAFACEEVATLDKQLPSANEAVNRIVNPIGNDIFTPENTAVLANKLMQALKVNAIQISQVEEQVNMLIKYMFDLFEKDEDIIRAQADKINLLKTNKVETLYTATTVLKKSTRLFVGAENTGLTSTALTWSGILSRRRNVILLDMTHESKLGDYGVKTVSVDEFLGEVMHTELLCVHVGDQLSPTELQTVMDTVDARLAYYAHVNIIVSATNTDLINALIPDAISVHFVTNCSTMSTAALRNVVATCKMENTAKKLVTIDTPISPLTIATNIGIDPTLCQFIPIPHNTAIKMCAIRHDRPYEYSDVVRIYEEAFE